MSFYYTTYEELKAYMLSPSNSDSFKEYITSKKHEIILTAFENGIDESDLSIMLEAFTISYNSLLLTANRFHIDLFLITASNLLEIFCLQFKLKYEIVDLQNSIELVDLFDIFEVIRINQISFQINLLQKIIIMFQSTQKRVSDIIKNALELIMEIETDNPRQIMSLLEFVYKLNIPLDSKKLNTFLLSNLSTRISDYIFCKSIEKIESNNYSKMMEKITINDYLGILINYYNCCKADPECIDTIINSLDTFDTIWILEILHMSDIILLTQFVNILLQIITNISENSGYLSYVFYGNQDLTDNLTLETFSYQAIDRIVLGIFKIFETKIQLCDTYLLRKVPLILLQTLKGTHRNRCFVFNQLFALMDLYTPYFKLYLSSICDDSLFVSKAFYEFVKKNSERFKELLERDVDSTFTDNISGTFIIIPAVIQTGETKIWVDKYVMMSCLATNPVNPYTREPLTIQEFEETNIQFKEEIFEYEQKRREFIVSNIN